MNKPNQNDLVLRAGDALVVVDVQNDFLPGGSLAVPAGDEVVPVINRYIALFQSRGLPVYTTRDWHPEKHCSFEEQGGIWPVHCVARTTGSQFPSNLHLPDSATVISKAVGRAADAYSGFEGTDLNKRLQAAGVHRLFIGGLATDYCVLNTVKDALKNDFSALLLLDAIRAVNVEPEDGTKAVDEMIRLGASTVEYKDIEFM
jgi:nicotinamidase/pyrazinamidase